MTNRFIRKSSFVWHTFAAMSAALVVAGIATSLLTRDPHYLGRFGAIIAAIGVVLVVRQIQFDLAVEREFQGILERIDEEDDTAQSPVLEEVAERIKKQSKSQVHEEVKKSRTSAAIVVATITGAGEILAGWGDWLMRQLERIIS